MLESTVNVFNLHYSGDNQDSDEEVRNREGKGMPEGV